MRPVHTTQRNDRHGRPSFQLAETQSAERSCSKMRTSRENGGKHHGIGTHPVRIAYFAQRMGSCDT